jgi:hypothetical protein
MNANIDAVQNKKRTRNKDKAKLYNKNYRKKTAEMKKVTTSSDTKPAAGSEFKDISTHILSLLKEGGDGKQSVRDAITAVRLEGNLDEKIIVVKAYLNANIPALNKLKLNQLEMKEKCPDEIKDYVNSFDDDGSVNDAALDDTIAFAESFSRYVKGLKDYRRTLKDPLFADAINVGNILKRAKEQKDTLEKQRALHISDQSSLTYDDFPQPPQKSVAKPAAEVPSKTRAADTSDIAEEADSKKAKTAGFFGSIFGL